MRVRRQTYNCAVLLRILGSMFLLCVAAWGMWELVWPRSMMRFRRRMGWSENFLSGGCFYSTENRVEWTCSALVVIGFGGAARLIWLLFHPGQ